VSEKTGRGPLEDTWLEDYWIEVQVYIPFFSFFLYFFRRIFTPVRLSSFTVDTLAILSLGKATANAVGKVTNVRVQAMPSRVPLLGHANEIRKIHTRRRLVPLRAHLSALSCPLDAGHLTSTFLSRGTRNRLLYWANSLGRLFLRNVIDLSENSD